MSDHERKPMLLEHCRTVYKALYDASKMENDLRVYEGFTTHLFKGLNLSIPYYTRTMKELKRMDCIRQVRRGGSSTPSKWLLLQEPTDAVFDSALGTPTSTSSTQESLAQMVRDLHRRLQSAEADILVLKQVLLERNNDNGDV